MNEGTETELFNSDEYNIKWDKDNPDVEVNNIIYIIQIPDEIVMDIDLDYEHEGQLKD